MDKSNPCFDFRISAGSIRLFYAGIVIIDIALLAAYLLLRSEILGPLDSLRAQLDLRHENAAAVWYSGVILFLTGMAALLCFHVDSSSESSPRFGNILRYGWLVIALTFMGFSFDEMGSIHERVELLLPEASSSYGLGLSGWIDVLWPLMVVVFSYYVLFFCTYLSRYRISQLLALVGVGFLISVPVQEFLESKLRLAGQKRGTLTGILEEGSELIGMTLFLISFLEFIILRSRRSPGALVSPGKQNLIQISLSSQSIKLSYALGGLWAMASIAMAWFLLPHLEDLHHRGNPDVWYPSIALFIAGVVSFINFSLEDESTSRLNAYSLKWLWGLVGAVCLWFSVDSESGINKEIFTYFIKSHLDLSLLPTRTGDLVLSAIIIASCSVVFLTVAGIRTNRSSRWLFCLGVVSWVGVFAASSWEIKETLKILSPTFFLLSFVESMKYLYVAVPRKASGVGLEHNPVPASV